MKNIRLKIALPLVLIGIAWIQEIVDQMFFNGTFNLPIQPDFGINSLLVVRVYLSTSGRKVVW